VARIRTIKPEFFTSETLASVPKSARLTFIGLWTYADDNGVALDNFRLIAAALYPLEEDVIGTLEDVAEELRTLERIGVIQRYSALGKRLLFVTNWDEHQKISHPAKPRYHRPAPGPNNPPGPHPEISRNPPETFRRVSGDSPRTPSGAESGAMSDDRLISNGHFGQSDSDAEEAAGQSALPQSSGSSPETLRPEQGTGNREQGKEQGTLSLNSPTQPPLLALVESEPLAALAESELNFEDFWGFWPRKVSKPDAEKAWKKAVKERASPADIVEACKAYAERCHLVDRPKDKTPYPATWLNRRGWTDDLDEEMPLAANRRNPPRQSTTDAAVAAGDAALAEVRRMRGTA